jgi:hypothetical protein
MASPIKPCKQSINLTYWYMSSLLFADLFARESCLRPQNLPAHRASPQLRRSSFRFWRLWRASMATMLLDLAHISNQPQRGEAQWMCADLWLRNPQRDPRMRSENTFLQAL